MNLPGGMELIIIAGLVVLLFGVKKLPALGGAVGESIKNFKKGIKDINEDSKKEIDSSDKKNDDK